MSIFNSLGSNYNLGFAFKSVFSSSNKKSSELKDFLEKKYHGSVFLTYKGREAIELGLQSLNLPKDSYVAINGFTCFAVYEAIKKANLNCEYLDIEKDGLNFTADELNKHLEINPKIKVVIIQNTLGFPCEIEKIIKVCQKNKLILIEDLAHSVGCTYISGLEAGQIGDMVILSFSQDKIIDAISGGALISKKIIILEKNKIQPTKQTINKLYPLFTLLIRNSYSLGIGKSIHFMFKNFNLLSKPMDSKDQIHKLPSWYENLIISGFSNMEDNLSHRRKIATIYKNGLYSRITFPKILESINLSSNLRFPIFVKNRDSLIKFLKNHQIFVSDIWYDAPIAPKKYLAQTDYNNQCPNAEKTSDMILNLPTHENVSEKDANNIVNLINKWINIQ